MLTHINRLYLGDILTNLGNFLSRNSVQLAKELPLIHSTQAFHVRSIMKSQRIIANACDVFLSEKLNYFFVGRPAFKPQDNGSQAEHWQLPCCFIFEFSAIAPIKRIFPFDSGAFSGRRYPKYINDLQLDDFEINNVPNAPQRIIGAFFGTSEAYMRISPKGKVEFEKEFTLQVLDHDIRALHKLAGDSSHSGFDDRRITIEVQSPADVDLNISRPLAVILPNLYLADKAVREFIEVELKAQPIGYPTHPLSQSTYYSSIYEAVWEFYRSKEIL